MLQVHDWETDPRPFADCLKAWQPGWTRDRKSAELRVGSIKPDGTTDRGSFDRWCDGRRCEREASLRRLMTLIDQLG